MIFGNLLEELAEQTQTLENKAYVERMYGRREKEVAQFIGELKALAKQ